MREKSPLAPGICILRLGFQAMAWVNFVEWVLCEQGEAKSDAAIAQSSCVRYKRANDSQTLFSCLAEDCELLLVAVLVNVITMSLTLI